MSTAEPTAGRELPVQADTLPEGGEGYQSGSMWRLILAVFLENRLAIVGLVLIVFMTLFSFVGPLIYHTQQEFNNPSIAHLPPSLAHPMGTNPVGFDTLGRLMLGGQSSLEVGFAAAIIAVLIGVVWGAVSGLAGGIVDTIMMRIVDALLAIPFLVALIILGTIFTTSTLELVIVIGLVAWLVPARLVRGETLSLRVREYVQAVRVMGGRAPRVIFRHLVPNVIGTIVVQATFLIVGVVFLMTALQFIGVGLAPTIPTWGGMLSDATSYIADGYWWMFYPVLVILVLTVIAFSLIGDALRDSLDVRLQRR